jgi:hypothetical protein
MKIQQKMRIGIVVSAVAFVSLLAYSSLQHTRFRYEVCVAFGGRTHCAVAEGATPEEAIRAAQTIGCSLLTSGRDENIRCLDQPPASVRALAAP